MAAGFLIDLVMGAVAERKRTALPAPAHGGLLPWRNGVHLLHGLGLVGVDGGDGHCRAARGGGDGACARARERGGGKEGHLAAGGAAIQCDAGMESAGMDGVSTEAAEWR